MRDNENELFPVVDADGQIIGSVTRGHAHDGSKILHPVVHLHVFNSRGELYLQHRPAWKDMGITEFQPVSMGHYVFESKRERELVFVHRCVYDGEVQPSKDELDGGRFWTAAEIADNMGKGVFTPNFENEYRKFFLPEKK